MNTRAVNIQVFHTTRWPGFMALVWQSGQVIQVVFCRDIRAAYDDAREWSELHRMGLVES